MTKETLDLQIRITGNARVQILVINEVRVIHQESGPRAIPCEVIQPAIERRQAAGIAGTLRRIIAGQTAGVSPDRRLPNHIDRR
jgi:hypothetical protein